MSNECFTSLTGDEPVHAHTWAKAANRDTSSEERQEGKNSSVYNLMLSLRAKIIKYIHSPARGMGQISREIRKSIGQI